MTENKYLPYSGQTVDQMRTAMLVHVNRIEKGIKPYGPLRPANQTEAEGRYLGTLVVQYGYSLAALLKWIGDEAGEDIQFQAAAFLDDIMMNGGDDENADLVVSDDD